MSTENATNPEISKPDMEAVDSEKIDQAIDDLHDLHGTLKQDKEKLDASDMATAGHEASDEVEGFVGGVASDPETVEGGIGDVSVDEATVTGATGQQTRADLIMDIPIDVQVVLGTNRMQVSTLMNLNEGAIIGLERKIGEPVEITVNGKLIGRGEITVLKNDDTRFGIRITEVIGSQTNTG